MSSIIGESTFRGLSAVTRPTTTKKANTSKTAKTAKVPRVNTIEYNSNINNTQKHKKSQRKSNLKTFIENPVFNSFPENPGGLYLIPEIPIREFFYCTTRLYKMIESDINNSTEDIFMKAIYLAQNGSNEDAWNTFNNLRKYQQAFSQRLGDFHEEIAGKLPGYRTLPQDHWTGLDVIKEDRSEIYEWKNSTNVSTETLTTVYNKFKTLINERKIDKCFLVCVNVPDKWKAPEPKIKRKNGKIVVDLTGPEYIDRVIILNGREAYAHMSGSKDFYDRLLQTVYNMFQQKSLMNSVQYHSTKMNIDA